METSIVRQFTPEQEPLSRRSLAARFLGALAGLGTGAWLGGRAASGKKGKKKKPAGCKQTACFVRAWGSEGTGEGQFGFPNGIAVAANGDVFVSDEFQNRVQRFSASGEFLLQWGSAGS